MNNVKQDTTKEEFEIERQKIEPSSGLASEQFVARIAKQEHFPKIKGIGPATLEKLKNAGITSIEQLVKVSPNELKNHGFGLKFAQKIVDATKDYMNEGVGQRHLLQNEATLEEDSLFHTRVVKNNQNLESRYIPTQEKKGEKFKVETIKEFDENTDINEQTQVDESVYFKEEQIEKPVTDEVSIDTNDSLISSFLRTKFNDNEKQRKLGRVKNKDFEMEQLEETEHLNITTLKTLVKEIEITLKKADFYILPKSSSFEPFYNYLNIIAVKINTIKELLDVVHVIPIKICTLKGSAIVSEEEVKYHPTNFDFYDPFMIHADLEGLLMGQEAIYTDFKTSDSFVQFLKTYMKKEIEIEKTFSNKRLFFRHGPIQYKIVVDPLLLCQKEVNFLEKKLLFPYQRSSNFHIISIDQLSCLLEFLEKKYAYVETYSEQESSIKKNSDCVDQFLSQWRIISMPFIAFGFLFLTIFLFMPSLLKTFISLSIASLTLFFIVSFFTSFKFRKRRYALKEEFNTPYYNLLNINETDAISIAEELAEEEARQFFYECFGKDEKYSILLLDRSKTEEKNLFLKKKEMVLDTPKTDVIEHDSFLEKYRSFLED